MRNMSFFLTTPQLLAGTKTVTRRLGWAFLKPGDRFCAVEKCQGLKAGEHVNRLAECEVVNVRRERLDAINQADVIAEGFPDLTPEAFVDLFCRANRCTAETDVTRIEFRKLQKKEQAA